MSASASNLSNARYRYDMVCATTQDSVNATMKEFLSGIAAQEFSACYTFNPATREKVLTPLSEIVAKIGGDPFSIPDGADETNPLVAKLYNDCKFVFGFKAKTGLPDGVAPAAMPDIVRLDKGNSLVSYLLYCAEFSVIVLNQNFGSLSFTNLSQPAASPWEFQFEVNLGMRAGDQNAFNNLPADIQQRIKDLNPNSAFSVQQLYLDLNSAGLEGMPTIQGLDPTSDAYVYLTRTFINQYWKNLGSSGVVLGYSVQPVTPDNQAPSIIPTDLNIEVSPYLDAQGNATTTYGMYTLNYLVMSKGATMPPAVTFNWNWVEQSEATDYHGAIAIRRDIFFDYLLALLNQAAPSLCIHTHVDLSHSGETYTISYSWSQPAADATSFTKLAQPGAPDADGFASIMSLSFGCESYDSSEASSHMSSINGNFNYSMSGDVAISSDTIRITLHAIVYVEYNTHELGDRHTIVSGNALDLTHTIKLQVAVDEHGHLAVNQTSSDSGGVQTLYYGSDPLMTNLGNIKDNVTNCSASASTAITTAMSSFGSQMTDMINGSHGWVFPGGKTFLYKAAGFSTAQDLIAHVTYVDPS